MAKAQVFYHHLEYDAYQCMGCDEYLETPHRAILKSGHAAVRVKDHAENRLIWLELQERSHTMCLKYNDAQMARQMREFHIHAAPRGDDGPVRHRVAASA